MSSSSGKRATTASPLHLLEHLVVHKVALAAPRSDALARANYRNAKAGVMPNRTFLNRFFENMLASGKNELCSRDLMVQTPFDDPTLLRNVETSKAIKTR